MNDDLFGPAPWSGGSAGPQEAATPVAYDAPPASVGTYVPASGSTDITVAERGILSGIQAAIPAAGVTAARRAAIPRFLASIASAVPSVGPWGFVARLLALIAVSEIGEFLITKAYEALTGAFTGSDEPGDGGSPAVKRNVRDASAAAFLLSRTVRKHPGMAEALAYIAAGRSSGDAVSYLELSAQARSFVLFFEFSTDAQLMKYVQFKAIGPFQQREEA